MKNKYLFYLFIYFIASKTQQREKNTRNKLEEKYYME